MPAGRRGRLHAARGVHDIAGHRLADLRAGAHRDHGLAGVHRHPDRVPALGGGHQLERRADRALGVVLVRDRGAEHAHRRVADELVQVAAEALDRRLRLLVERDEGATDVLGVGGVRALREPDEIDEQDRHGSALFGGGRGQRCPAGHAEASLGRILGAAVGARHHGGSLWGGREPPSIAARTAWKRKELEMTRTRSIVLGAALAATMALAACSNGS